MRTWLLASAALLSIAAAEPAIATLLVYEGNLSGSAEVPAAPSPGSGFTTVTYDDVARTLHVQITFQDLLGATTASHIHVRPTPADLSGGVITQTPTFAGFPLGVMSGSYDQTFDMTLASSYNPSFLNGPVAGGSITTALAYLLSGLADGRAYLNVHTSLFPAGEIRANLAPPAAIPEPAIWGLMIAGFGLTGLALRARRRLAPMVA